MFGSAALLASSQQWVFSSSLSSYNNCVFGKIKIYLLTCLIGLVQEGECGERREPFGQPGGGRGQHRGGRVPGATGSGTR